jgi:hypothetical protein
MALTISAPPALSFESLGRLLPAIPVRSLLSEPIIFQYLGFPDSSPAGQLDELLKSGDLGSIGLDKYMLGALRSPAGAKAVTGIDFSVTRGVLVSGPPLLDVTAVLGRDAFAEGARTMLESRGFERSTIGGFSVWSKGRDAAIDFMSREVQDPFGHGMGRSQRIAVLDDLVVVAPTTVTLQATLVTVRLPRSCVICPTVAGMLDAARHEAGADAKLVAAAGFGLGAIASHPELVAIIRNTDPKLVDRKVDEFVRKRLSRQTMPAFRIVVTLATRTGPGGLAQLALAYGSESEARAGSEVVAKRLSAAAIGAPGIRTAAIGAERPRQKGLRPAVVERDGEWIAVISLEYDGAWTEAWKEYRIWQELVMSRAFNVLDLFD